MGELADNTITNPIPSNNNIVITKVKSIGLFKKLEKVFSFLFFAGSFLFLGFFLNRRESKKKDTITVVKILKNAEMAEPSDLIDGEEENGKG